MSEYLCDGAELKCLRGSETGKLISSNQFSAVMAMGAMQATVSDCKPVENIPYFGECSKEGKPCEECMDLEDAWVNIGVGSKITEFNGEEALLVAGSILICKVGGFITPLDSGQGVAIGDISEEEFMQYMVNLFAYLNSRQLLGKMFGADPVDLTTGNFTYHKADLKIQGILPLEFERNYHSLKIRKGVLGTGWSHNYEMSLEWQANNLVNVITEEGNQILFREDMAGNLTGVLGEVETLKKQKNLYVYTDRNGLCSYFTKEGRLLRQKDQKGNSREFSYNDKGLLKEVSNLSGGQLFYHYNEADQLIYVRDHTDRKVSIIHSYGRLIEVTNANGDTYRYNYNSNKDITEIINPLGITVVRNTYNGFHQVIRQVLADDSEFQFRYDLPNYRTYMKDRSGIVSTYQQNEKYQNISATDIEGGEQKEYNQKGQITKHTDRKGYVTRYSYDNRGNLTRVIDADKRKWDFAYTEDDQVKRVRLGGIDRYQLEYDEQGDPIRMTDAVKRITRVQYNNERKPLSLTQPDGSEIQLNYDARGNIIKMATPVGVTEYTYDALNRVIASKNGNGHVTRFGYNVKDELVEVENAEGNHLAYTYNGVGKVTKAVNYDGSVQEWEYDVCNQPVVYRDALQRETIYRYNRMGKVSQMILPDGAEQSYEYDLKRRLIKETNGVGSTRAYAYDGNGNLVSVTDGEGNVTDYTYDGLNRLTTITDPIEGVTSYKYDVDGNLSEVINPAGNSSRMEYNEAGQLIKETDVLGNVTEYTYTLLGKVNTIRDAADMVTRREYLPGGILKGVIYPDGTKESYGYDANGNMTKYTNKSGFTLTYEYDSLDRIIAIRGSEGELKTYSYDAVGNVLSMTDALGNKTSYEYSPTGNLVKVTDAAGNEVEYTYDPCDRLIEIRQYGEVIKGDAQLPEAKDAELQHAQNRNEINRRCQITTYERDKAGQVEKIRNALGEEEFYQYDKEGRLIQKEDRDGYVTKYGYTPLGDLNEIQYADGREVKMQYNALRQLIMVEDWLGQLDIEVDAIGRTQEVTYPDGKKVAYTYGSQGERKSITYPDGKEVKYGYDPYLRLAEVKSDNLEVTYGYDEVGRLAEKKFQNGMNSRYRYDQKGQLRELVHSDLTGELDRYEYGYDLLGNKNHIKKQRRGLMVESGSYEYQYDALNRLSGVIKDGVMQREYAYDAFHNRSSMKEWVLADGSPNPEGSVRTDYEYDIAGRLASLTKTPEGKVYSDSIEGDQLNGIPVHEETYNYDKRGNLTHIYKDGQLVNQYYFGALNRLESAMNYEIGQGASYQYDGLGNRVGKVEGTLVEPVLPVDNIIDLSLVPTKRIDDMVDLTKQFHNLLQRIENKNITTFIWDENVLSAIGEEGTFNYVQDSLGSTVRVIDSFGKNEEIYDYSEFGQESGSYKRVIQPFGYTGYQRDRSANSYYAQAREYHSEVGRFMSEDVIKGTGIYPFTLNHYSYCYNSPMALIDLNGQSPVDENTESIFSYIYEELDLADNWKDLILNPIVVDGGSQGKSHFYDDALYGDKDILSWNGKALSGSAGSDKTGNYTSSTSQATVGLNIVNLNGGIGKIGYKDLEGVWQGQYELETVHGGINLGVSSDYAGIKASGSLVTVSGKVRVIEIGGYRFYLGGNFDMISAGLKFGLSLKEKRFDMGASLGIGGGISISWEKAEDIECQ